MKKSIRLSALLLLLSLLLSCEEGVKSVANDMVNKELALKRRRVELQIEEVELAIEKAKYLKELSPSECQQFNNIYYQRSKESRRDASLHYLEQELNERYSELDKILKQSQ